MRYERAIEDLDVSGLRAVWSPDLGFAPVDPEVAEVAGAAAAELAAAARLRSLDRPVRLTDPVRVWLSCGAADVWMNVEEGMYPDRADDFDRPVQRTLALTVDYPITKYARALARRQQLEDEVAELFTDVDVVMTPTTAVPAFPAEGLFPREINGVEVRPEMSVPFTMLANLCWNPAVSVPAGLTSAGLPVGLQIMVRRHADEVALRLARIFEQARPWPRFAPGWDV
jgi:aspartyl-tRNA(Asn)/glutamyl-tRNA(Gln) amidotransferase subunit A